ncbi:MAG: AAA family ATPase [Anaerolineae bacterium]|nr:AAA family ATPase [Anaerolineae bacterium]
MRIVFAGPCGVGKSTVAKLLADQYSIKYLSLDEIRSDDMSKRAGQISPCSVSRLDLRECLAPTLNTHNENFVLDLGGDSVFRKSKDNEERLEQVFWLKRTYQAKIVVLTSQKDNLRRRFLSAKNRATNEFDEMWQTWIMVEEPHWQRCTDQFLDTTNLTPENVIGLINTS